jgi:hypothetical protein
MIARISAVVEAFDIIVSGSKNANEASRNSSRLRSSSVLSMMIFVSGDRSCRMRMAVRPVGTPAPKLMSIRARSNG